MRYRKGELIVCEDGMNIEHSEPRYVKAVFAHHGWGRADGKTTIITRTPRSNLMAAVQWDDGEVLLARDVDVKNLLELGRVVIEKNALEMLLTQHQSDLGKLKLPAPYLTAAI